MINFLWRCCKCIYSHAAVDCGSPPTIDNGSPAGAPTSTTPGGTVIYTCDTGYEVSTGVSIAMATCMASGTWGPLPTCSHVYQIPLVLHTLNVHYLAWIQVSHVVTLPLATMHLLDHPPAQCTKE